MRREKQRARKRELRTSAKSDASSRSRSAAMAAADAMQSRFSRELQGLKEQVHEFKTQEKIRHAVAEATTKITMETAKVRMPLTCCVCWRA